MRINFISQQLNYVIKKRTKNFFHDIPWLLVKKSMKAQQENSNRKIDNQQ